MPFVAREVAIQIVKLVGPVIRAVETRDRALADQMKRSAVSVISNLNEGARRRGKDRPQMWRTSSGSADELLGQVQTAVIWGHVEEPTELMQALDRYLGLLWGCTERSASTGARARDR
jgi:four helix bundle protein